MSGKRRMKEGFNQRSLVMGLGTLKNQIREKFDIMDEEIKKKTHNSIYEIIDYLRERLG